MKKIFSKQSYILLFSFVMLTLNTAVVLAQDASSGSSTQSTTTTTTEHSFVVPMWAWIVGGLVLLLIIIALISKNKSGTAHTDKVTYTKTTSSE